MQIKESLLNLEFVDLTSLLFLNLFSLLGIYLDAQNYYFFFLLLYINVYVYILIWGSKCHFVKIFLVFVGMYEVKCVESFCPYYIFNYILYNKLLHKYTIQSSYVCEDLLYISQLQDTSFTCKDFLWNFHFAEYLSWHTCRMNFRNSQIPRLKFFSWLFNLTFYLYT